MKKLIIRIMTAVLLAAALCGAFAACSDAADGGTADTADAAEGATLRIRSGTVVTLGTDTPVENLLAVEVWEGSETKVLYLRTDKAAEFKVGDLVLFSCYENAQPVDTFNGSSVWEAVDVSIHDPVAMD